MMEDGELLDELGQRLKERKGKRPALLSEGLQTVELGFSVEVQEREELLRGHYDASRLQRDNPKLVRLVEWLLSLQFVPWDVIAREAGMTWMSVQAIALARKESIKEFKARNAKSLQLVIEAALPGLMEKAKAGKLSALDVKMLVDCYLLMAGEPTAINSTADKPPPDPEEVELLRFLEARPVQSPALGMGLEVGKIPAMAVRDPVTLDAGTGLPVDSPSTDHNTQHSHHEQSPHPL